MNLAYPNSRTRRGRVGKQIAQTLLASCQEQGVMINDINIRKYTPREYFRLMGFDDIDVDLLIEDGISDTQIYKMAGNSIVVDVLECLFGQLFDSDGKLFL